MLAQSRPLNVWDRIGLLALLALAIAVGCITVIRSAYVVPRRGDFAVFGTAAWAIRSGGDLRQSALDWHYVYPATLAVLMVPLAEPPANQPDAVALPLGVSVAIWCVINLLCLVLAMHVLANLLERPDPHRPRDRAWWRLRIFPALACAPGVIHTLTRGQVNLILLALICGLSYSLRGRAIRAGACLAGAICLKIIPALLLVVPVWRRDARGLAGCAIGLVVLGVLVPILGLGIDGTINDYHQFGRIVLGPGLGFDGDQRAAGELTNVVGTDSQSPMRVIHAWLHPDRDHRTTEIPAWIRRTHWLLGGCLVLLTLLAGKDLCGWTRNRPIDRSRRSMPENLRMTLFVGLMTIHMMLLSPVCHAHYMCLAIPAFAALLAWDWQNRTDDWISYRLAALMAMFLLGTALPSIPALERLDDGGLAGIALLVVGLAGLMVLWQTRPRTVEVARVAGDLARAAKPRFGGYVSPSTSLRTSSET